MTPQPERQHQPVSATRSTALDLWVDIVSDIVVAEVLREQREHTVECESDQQREDLR